MKLLTIIMSSALLMACTTTKSPNAPTTISIDMSHIQDAIPLSSFANSVDIVRLETSDHVLLGTVLKVVANNKQYYVWDENAIYTFDANGHCLHTLNKKGEGPGQYIGITDFDVDDCGNIWVLASSSKAIYKYSPTGDYLTGISLTGSAMKIKLMDDDRLIVYRGILMDDENKHAILIYDLHTRQVIKRLLPINPVTAQYLFIFTKNHFSNHFPTPSAACNFFQLFNDTIYTLTSEDIQPQFVIDKGGRNIPSAFFHKDFDNVRDFFEDLAEHKYAYGTDFFIENERGYYYHFLYEWHNHMAFIPKNKDEQTVVFRNIIVDKLLNGYKIEFDDELIQLFIQANNEVIIPVMPYKVEEHLHQKEVNDDRNPLLLIVKLQ